jgi:hypothetical protein
LLDGWEEEEDKCDGLSNEVETMGLKGRDRYRSLEVDETLTSLYSLRVQSKREEW